MPRGIRKNKGEASAQASPSPAPLDQKDEVIQLDDGTQYRTVAGRVAKFNNDYPDGMITVELLTSPENKEYFVVKAKVYPHATTALSMLRYFEGLGQCERIPGDKFASLEKAETTAIGRALAHMSTTLMGAAASEDEINKAKGTTALQQSIKESVREEQPSNPKGEPNPEELKGDELSQYNDWAIELSKATTKEELTELGKRVKEANLPKRVTEELRKLFNKQLRGLASQEKENAPA